METRNTEIKEQSFNQQYFQDYEFYCIDYHRQNYNQKTYHWKFIPESVLFDAGFITDFNKIRMNRKKMFEDGINYVREYGLDGIAEEKIDENTSHYHGIQCKLWNRNLTANDLGTFFSVYLARFKMKNPLSKAYLYHTSKLQIDLQDDIDNTLGQVNRTKLLFDINQINQNNNLIENVENKELKETEFELRDYQIEAIHALNQEWDGIKTLTIPCGMGKTVIFANHLKEKRYKNIFIMSPLKVHVKQNLDRVKEFLGDYETLLLDSDEDGTTNYEDLKNILDKNCIISTTFKSAENLFKEFFIKNKVDNIDDFDEDEEDEEDGLIKCPPEDDKEDDEEEDEETQSLEDDEISEEQEEYESLIDLSNSILIIDEAHNLINKDELIEIIKCFPKVLLVTATPPSCMEDKFGSESIYHYEFKRAIDEKYICDYEIYLPIITKNTETEESNVMIEIPIELNDLNEELTKKSMFLMNGMLQTGSRRCIVYLSRVEECEEFIRNIKEVNNKYHYLDIWIEMITGEVTNNKRNEILNDFQNDDDKRLKILCSIQILNECIDIPKCDSVFIGNVCESSSEITMVQRLCRANRLLKENPNKIANCFMWTDDLNKIVGTLSLLKNNDIDFHKKIKVMNGEYIKNNNKEMIELKKTENKKLDEYLKVKCMSLNDIWEMKKNLLFKFCEENRRAPKKKEIYGSFKINDWYRDQKKKIKNDKSIVYLVLSQNSLLKIELDKYIFNKNNNNIKFFYNFEEKRKILFDYCNINNKIPHTKDKKNMGAWFSQKKFIIKSNKDNLYNFLSQNLIIKNELDNYLDKRKNKNTKKKYTFDESKELFLNYCSNNQKIPGKNDYENQGVWYRYLKRKIDSIEHEYYLLFINNNIIKKDLDKYLENKNNNKNKVKLTEEQKIEILFNYCIKNKKHPISSNKEHMGQWFSHQKEKINSKQDDLYIKLSQNLIIKKELDEYLEKKEKNKNKQIIKLSEDEKLQIFFKYCNEHNEIPYQSNKENMGNWFTDKKKLIKTKDDELYKMFSQNLVAKKALDVFIERFRKNK